MSKIKTAKTIKGHGKIIYIGDERTEELKIELINYTKKRFEEKKLKKIEECFPFKKGTVTWLNVIGIHHTEAIEKIGKKLNIHHLVLEDIANTTQRPKIEDYEDYLFAVLKMIFYDEINNELNFEQVSLIIGKNYVISFQEKEGDIFESIRERIRKGGRLRNMKSDYLAYTLIDSVVDNYFPILDKVSDKADMIEKELIQEPIQKTLHNIYNLKRELILLHKSVWPLRDLISIMMRSESGIVQKTTRVYLGDVYDHAVQVIDNVETFRDLVAGMHETYLSVISNKLNEIMKVLTVISTIFIPLTFITSIYGMNFHYMPELGLAWMYPLIWAIVLICGILMYIYFKRKKWI